MTNQQQSEHSVQLWLSRAVVLWAVTYSQNKGRPWTTKTSRRKLEETVFVSVIGLCLARWARRGRRLPVSATALLFFLSGIVSLAWFLLFELKKLEMFIIISLNHRHSLLTLVYGSPKGRFLLKFCNKCLIEIWFNFNSIIKLKIWFFEFIGYLFLQITKEILQFKKTRLSLRPLVCDIT